MATTTPTKRKSRRKTTTKQAKTKAYAADSSVVDPASITNYTTALKWLYNHVDHERQRSVKYDDKTFSLDRMRRLLALMDNPHKDLKCIQVAGTKGKGSTCAMLAAMLEGCGFVVGSYSSPHLTDLRERIAIDGRMIPYADLADIFRQIAEVEADFTSTRGIHGPLTFFEIMTAASLKYFADQAVDFAVLETGLGGRLDCCTVVDPLVTAVTAISLDHTQWLGESLGEIAKEKAGIFKKGVPALTIPQDAEAGEALASAAKDLGVELEVTGEQIDFSCRFEASKQLGPHSRVCLTTNSSKFEHLAVPLKGEHQAYNCGLALAILDKLKVLGYHIPEDQAIRGLANTQLPGRMEVIHPQPRVVIDGAHNPASLTALIKSLGAHMVYDSLVMVFGCGQDKDIESMLQQVALGADKVIFTKARNNPRAVEPNDLIKQFSSMTGKMAQTAPSLAEAIQLAGRAVSREDLILVTGSFYLAGEARKYFMDAAAKRKRG